MSAPELVQAIAESTGYTFAQSALLDEALTHPSAGSGERGRRRAPRPRHYERLEFLGDRVLGLIVADLLWRRFTDEPEGDLTRRHTHLVRRETLARVAADLQLGRHLILSPGEAAAGTAENPGILADVCEALIAAIYLDGGFAAAYAVVRGLWAPLIGEMSGPPRDPKTSLQEWAQARALARPVYEALATSGPDHAPRFTIAVHVGDLDPAVATASSKRAAEMRAAAALLARLGVDDDRRGNG